jgi:hypothetical protein
MLTYADAKSLLDRAKDPRSGVVYPEKRNARIFWEDDDNPNNRNIVVYQWRSRYMRSYDKGLSMEERRKAADKERREHGENGRYHYGRHPVVMLFPNGNYTVWNASSLRYSGGYEIGRSVLPETVGWSGRVVSPEAGPPPKMRKVPEVKAPFFVASNGWPFAEESREHARQSYEEQVAKYGNLEAWHEAYAKASQIREANQKKLDAWKDWDGKKGHSVSVWDGAVFDSNGQATKTSWRPQKARLAREERIRKEEERKRQSEQLKREQEAKRRERAFKESVKSGDVQKVYDSLSEDMKTYLRLRNIAPNQDGTVTLMKYVREDYTSGHDQRVVYTPGTTVEDANFRPTTNCGHGLHFAATISECDRWNGIRFSGRVKQIICNVDLSNAVVVGVIDHTYKGYTEEVNFQDTKVKARKCLVLGDGDGTDSRKVVKQKSEKPKRGSKTKVIGKPRGSLSQEKDGTITYQVS